MVFANRRKARREAEWRRVHRRRVGDLVYDQTGRVVASYGPTPSAAQQRRQRITPDLIREAHNGLPCDVCGC